MVNKSKYDDSIKKCHYHQVPMRYNFYNSHYSYINEKKSRECTSVICDDLNNGMTIEQVWKKEYECIKKERVSDGK